MRAIIYKRQSIYREESASLETQGVICEDYCARRGYEVVATEQDPGESGTKVDRPGFVRVTKRLEAGQADVVVAWKWSRYFRHRLYFNLAIHEIESRGAVLESATEPVDTTTAAGRLQRGMLAEFAAFESERTGEVWKETQERRRRAGLPHTGQPRFGYDRLGDLVMGRNGPRLLNEHFDINKDEAEIVEWAYSEHIAGRGFASLTWELNRKGVRNKKGNVWAVNTLKWMLDSGFAAGLLYRGGGINSERTYFPGAHEPIIDQLTWEAYRAIRSREHKPAPRPGKYPLTGLVRCGAPGCDSSMNVTGSTRDQVLRYECTRWRQTGQGKAVTVSYRRMEARVKEWLAECSQAVGEAAASDPTAGRQVLRAPTDAEVDRTRLAGINRRLAEARRQLIAERLTDAEYDEAVTELKAERRVVDERLLRAAEQAVMPSGAEVRRLSADLLDEWDLLPAQAINRVLRKLIRRVVVHPPERPYGRAVIIPQGVWDIEPPPG